MATTVDFNMPAEDYHAIDAFSSSSILKLLQSPAHYKVWREGERKQTDAMLIGEVTHTAILEPDLMERYEAISADVNLRTNAGRAQRQAEIEAARQRGKIPVVGSALDEIRNMQRSVLNHRGAMRLLDGVRAEVTVLWRDEEFDIPCKARIDGWRLDDGIVDLKTTKDASKRGFMLSARTYGYHAQAAHYMAAVEKSSGAPPPFFAWVAMEKEPPYAVACYVCPDNALRAGRVLRRRAMARYAECLRSGEWPGYTEMIEPLVFPPWALRTNDEEF